MATEPKASKTCRNCVPLREPHDRRVTAEAPRVTLREMLGPVGKVGTGCALHHNARRHVMPPAFRFQSA